MNQKEYQFQQAITASNPEDRKALLQEFVNQHGYAISPSQIIAIAKIVCAVSEVVCPIINDL